MTSPLPLERCPHCGSDARVEPHAALRFRCRACGKPRIPMDPNLARTDSGTTALLRAAYGARLAKFAWQIASIGAGVLAVPLAVFAALVSAVAGLGVAGTAALFLAPLFPLLLSFAFWRRAKHSAQQSSASIDRAWQRAVLQIHTASQDTLDAERLSQLLGIGIEEAARHLAEAELSQYLGESHPQPQQRIRVSDSLDEFDPLGELTDPSAARDAHHPTKARR